MTVPARGLLRLALPAAVIGAGVLAAPITAHADEPTAVLHISDTSDLREGQQVTVSGTGFRPGLSAVAVGLCKHGFTNGLTDCDLEGGATFVNIGADGTFGELTMVARSRFSTIDCAQQQCVIAAGPLPGTEPDAIRLPNSVSVLIGFEGTRFAGGVEEPPVAANPVAEDLSGPSVPLWSATAVLLLIVAGLAVVRPAAVGKTQEEE
ncbi:neocarzinostatin apoprotein domain-containing protein [Nocardia higoensis]|uniref:neocarzinostatin apoprotein domain-containing protein n=1 Tax=Nocardia higoensis TaxID=228599 RepID=UPI0002E2B2A1|nr:neocarzinostatin apoprotein domain-containing protein [Nocardia higoensis]